MWPILNRIDMGVDPFVELNRLHRQMSRHFDESYREATEYPVLNVHANPEQVTVILEAPGLDKDKLDLTLTGNTLSVAGERASGENNDKDVVLRNERYPGRFTRSVRLPYPVNPDRIRARYEQGILRVELPRSDESKPRKIQVEA